MGVNVAGKYCNTIGYADDLLLCSTSFSGLQELIDISTHLYTGVWNAI